MYTYKLSIESALSEGSNKILLKVFLRNWAK